jgi:predicted ATPase
VQHRMAGADAERCFHHALYVARTLQARSWELRAATSLARLLIGQNRTDEARATLAPVLASFSEGFETFDFKQAAALLNDARS